MHSTAVYASKQTRTQIKKSNIVGSNKKIMRWNFVPAGYDWLGMLVAGDASTVSPNAGNFGVLHTLNKNTYFKKK